MPEIKISYFSMEIGLSEDIHTYSGGLGVLAGDTLRAAADWGLPLVAITLVHRKGYFRQHLDENGTQSEEPDSWSPEEHLREMEPRVEVEVAGRPVRLRAWFKELRGVLGQLVPVYFLDSDMDGNDEASRRITDVLYGGDHRHRLSQEAVLGIGGVRMLAALGYNAIETYHMNEGHSALLTLELMSKRASAAGRVELSADDIASVRDHCVFTTHTPVAAGHDRFPADIVQSVLGANTWTRLGQLYAMTEPNMTEPNMTELNMTELNMTELALRHSRYVNGVARRHGDVTREMFNGYNVEAITNGVHAATWTAPSVRDLFDRHVPGWREDNQSLRYITYTPLAEIERAHRDAKRALLSYVESVNGVKLDENHFTLGFARRATAYKRADMLFENIARLNRIASDIGPLQIIYAGKAHPHDSRGKEIIRSIVGAKASLSENVQLVYLEDYGMKIGALLTSGTDLWLNTPEPPKEASGTSGMKAALNGVPSLSVLDGWWIEGHIESVTGWSIEGPSAGAEDLYHKLETSILPLFYGDADGYAEVRRHAISLNGSFFNTERMVNEYARQAYRLSE
ncbi:MAG: alpha-glucan family phosphorylase [Acidobacteriota bacterium]|nr:MAG: alpha-glucan family phosphorylase [Acidobacteriota bacterium]